MTGKERLDVLLVEKGLFHSRSRAKRAIMAGKIYVQGELVDKAGTQVSSQASIEVKGDKIPYVSRGGLKLARALKVFKVNPAGKEVIDVGASTGGFTDCLLQKGACKVYAVDVGYGQLAWKLRQDERVKVIEKTNFRHLTPDELQVSVPLIVIDVSFISLKLIVPPAQKFLTKNGQIIALIKPQFEAGPYRVGKKGLVKDKKVHQDILKELSTFFAEKQLYLAGLDYSPVTGAASSNIEYLIIMENKRKKQNDPELWFEIIKETVNSAHRKLVKE